MKEITRYQSSWGAWYVQVDNGTRMELKFDHEPKIEEVEKLVLSMPVIEEVKPPELVELTVDTAINYLQTKLAEAEPEDVAKISEFTKTAPTGEVIKVVK